MCFAPYNLTEAAQETQNTAREAMEYLFDTKEEMTDEMYLYTCRELKGVYERCDTFLHPEHFKSPFCEWSPEAQIFIKKWLQEARNVCLFSMTIKA